MSNWQRCLHTLETEIPVQQYNTWIRPLQSVEEDGLVRLLAPNAFVLDWVQKNYLTRLTELSSQMWDESAPEIRLEIGSVDQAPQNQPAGSSPEPTAKPGNNSPASIRTPASAGISSNLNPNFTFDTFVEGKSNQLARAASVQIAENPGTVYNPLFIYGGVGLGKTHLMHAVGNLIINKNPEAKVVYLHSEGFVAEMVRALQHNKIDQFKQKYRTVNALLIDDVQFFAGKERSQEEFFHTFNALFESQQQIILTSDRYPKEVNGLEERLKSRFGWGLAVAIEPADLETRVAILKSKSLKLFNVELPDDVAFFVGGQARSNIRELEGALRRIMANAHLTGQSLNVDFAKVALRDMIAAQAKMVSIENIQKTVAEYFKTRASDMLSSKRTRTVTRPRQIAMALAKELTNHSLPEIGERFGGRDHTTVLYATRKVAELREADTKFDEDYQALLRILSH
ncbi:chromosomal replication initiation protein DnaA [Solemya velum gill symbiont]|uniref:chromosomal replication initiator protein DnaA n=1 Tax=Solemya velum gill symbiont TaxID=2340 RepID=UPI0009964529|nr:chromosomal replication initiator protein DnaA [Solemya velum gill symbiont]OOZ16200.1 chromosomal replication initiation protein DnaA [Solemya velum gill symbiont]OOZ18967.1 chromosomal replication initiation protein DnaA [Solemya velum gill symbiont]OOZ20650.1 chromosomal replication initiation protein DnaA [Solemya velum gill symbiont]OOZ23188.1 chromosomal replication initiation protein DnaA [Solemya velum gill symbiont]OOZ24113.1 chromosomal replication initiation protein DnaA [Solemya